jgi:hypothetical protein
MEEVSSCHSSELSASHGPGTGWTWEQETCSYRPCDSGEFSNYKSVGLVPRMGEANQPTAIEEVGLHRESSAGAMPVLPRPPPPQSDLVVGLWTSSTDPSTVLRTSAI